MHQIFQTRENLRAFYIHAIKTEKERVDPRSSHSFYGHLCGFALGPPLQLIRPLQQALCRRPDAKLLPLNLFYASLLLFERVSVPLNNSPRTLAEGHEKEKPLFLRQTWWDVRTYLCTIVRTYLCAICSIFLLKRAKDRVQRQSAKTDKFQTNFHF